MFPSRNRRRILRQTTAHFCLFYISQRTLRKRSNPRHTHRPDRSAQGSGIHHPNVSTGLAYAVGFSGQVDEHEFGGDTLALAFSNIVDETDADLTTTRNSQRTRNEVIQFPEGLYNIDLHFNINLQVAQESRTLEVQLRQLMEDTDDIVVDFAR